MEEPKEQVPKQDYLAVLSMLVQRATFLDKWRARHHGGHWLNNARRELLKERATLDAKEYVRRLLYRMKL